MKVHSYINLYSMGPQYLVPSYTEKGISDPCIQSASLKAQWHFFSAKCYYNVEYEQ